MKKGKSCVIKGYKTFKCNYGTVDVKNLKSVYLNIQSWVKPKKIFDNWERPVSLLNQKFKSLVYETINQDIFQSKSIVDLDLRTSGISHKKKSFMNLEITFFFSKSVDFKSPIIKTEMKKIIDSINNDLIKKNEIFSFYLTKNDEKNNLQNS